MATAKINQFPFFLFSLSLLLNHSPCCILLPNPYPLHIYPALFQMMTEGQREIQQRHSLMLLQQHQHHSSSKSKNMQLRRPKSYASYQSDKPLSNHQKHAAASISATSLKLLPSNTSINQPQPTPRAALQLASYVDKRKYPQYKQQHHCYSHNNSNYTNYDQQQFDDHFLKGASYRQHDQSLHNLLKKTRFKSLSPTPTMTKADIASISQPGKNSKQIRLSMSNLSSPSTASSKRSKSPAVSPTATPPLAAGTANRRASTPISLITSSSASSVTPLAPSSPSPSLTTPRKKKSLPTLLDNSNAATAITSKPTKTKTKTRKRKNSVNVLDDNIPLAVLAYKKGYSQVLIQSDTTTTATTETNDSGRCSPSDTNFHLNPKPYGNSRASEHHYHRQHQQHQKQDKKQHGKKQPNQQQEQSATSSATKRTKQRMADILKMKWVRSVFNKDRNISVVV